jgi:hypothetical protein
VDEPSPERREGLLQAATDELLDRLRTLGDLTRSVGSTTLGAVPGPLPRAAADVLGSIRSLVDQVPPPTAVVDVFAEEVKAKRALVQAMQVQLASFDKQLELLEQSLGPLQVWGRQWAAVQDGVAEVLHLSARPSADVDEDDDVDRASDEL